MKNKPTALDVKVRQEVFEKFKNLIEDLSPETKTENVVSIRFYTETSDES